MVSAKYIGGRGVAEESEPIRSSTETPFSAMRVHPRPNSDLERRKRLQNNDIYIFTLFDDRVAWHHGDPVGEHHGPQDRGALLAGQPRGILLPLGCQGH